MSYSMSYAPTRAAESHARRIWYLDSSVALRILLGHSPGAMDWFDRVTEEHDQVVSSALLGLEVARVLRRESVDTELGRAFVESLTLLRVDDSLLREAADIRPHIKTLDAMHLASAQRIGAQFATIVTHDKRMAEVAAELGFAAFDPIRAVGS